MSLNERVVPLRRLQMQNLYHLRWLRSSMLASQMRALANVVSPFSLCFIRFVSEESLRQLHFP